MERENSLQYKTELALVLQQHRDVYWHSLKEYIKGTLTKQQFDHDVLKVLDRKYVPLHNRFIKSIQYNAKPEVMPPSGVGVGLVEKVVKKKEEGVEDEKLKRRLIQVLGQDDFEKLSKSKSVNGKIIETPPVVPFKIWTMETQPANRLEYERGLFTPMYHEMGYLSDMIHLKTRVIGICREFGITTFIKNEVLALLDQSLEFYLKNILTQLLLKTRSGKRAGVMSKRFGRLQTTHLKSPFLHANDKLASRGLNLKDLYFYMVQCPYLFPSIFIEKKNMIYKQNEYLESL